MKQEKKSENPKESLNTKIKCKTQTNKQKIKKKKKKKKKKKNRANPTKATGETTFLPLCARQRGRQLKNQLQLQFRCDLRATPLRTRPLHALPSSRPQSPTHLEQQTLFEKKKKKKK
jgi:hypothetical protein